MADSSITILTVDELGVLAGRLARNGRCGSTSIDGADWKAAKADCHLAARVLRHVIITGIVYSTLELEGC